MSANLTPEQMAATAHENFVKNQIDNTHIVPSLNTQVYAMGAFRDQYGEEKLVIDGYSEPRSLMAIINNNPLTWTEIPTPDPEPEDPFIVDSLPATGDAVDIVKLSTDGKYYQCSGAADPNNLKSTDSIQVIFELNGEMAELNPTPNVVIDGREYTTGVLQTDLIFYMNRDHRISIRWTADIIETFLIIANR